MKKKIYKDLFVTAYEGACSYWGAVEIDIPRESEQAESEAVFESIWSDGVEYKVTDCEDGESLGVINKANLKRGMRLMKQDYRWHHNDVTGENWDAITADVFLQLSVMGEIVYG